MALAQLYDAENLPDRLYVIRRVCLHVCLSICPSVCVGVAMHVWSFWSLERRIVQSDNPIKESGPA